LGYISAVVQNIVIAVEMLKGKLVEDQFVILSAHRSSPLSLLPPTAVFLSLAFLLRRHFNYNSPP
jgi:hypothetical protein